MTAVQSDNFINGIRTFDQLCAIVHPTQRLKMFTYLDFTRPHGHFDFLNIRMLKVFLFLSSIDCVCCIISISKAIWSNNIRKVQETVSVFSIVVLMFFRGLSLMIKKEELAKLYNDIDELFPRNFHDQQDMEVRKNHEAIEQRFKILHRFITLALSLFLLTPGLKFFMFYDFETMGPISDDFHCDASWLPFGIKQRLSMYPICYLYETILAIAATNLIVTWDEVFIVTISQLCMYFCYLSKRLKELDVKESNESGKSKIFHGKLRSYMIHHQCLQRLYADLNKIFNLSILVSDMAAAVSICFNLCLITNVDDYISVVTFAVPCIIEAWLLYDVAKWGTQLETVTSRINEVLYEKKWYDGSMDYCKFTLMWMQSTNKPLTLKAFEMFKVNMEHFQDMMMVAYQLLTFLKSKG